MSVCVYVMQRVPSKGCWEVCVLGGVCVGGVCVGGVCVGGVWEMCETKTT